MLCAARGLAHEKSGVSSEGSAGASAVLSRECLNGHACIFWKPDPEKTSAL
jgi:hypothetical protein